MAQAPHWTVNGEYFENCNCDVVCPCEISPQGFLRATPDQAARRSDTHTRLKNVFVAGDWTATGLPATIESAVRSGQKAAEAAMASIANERR